MPRRQVTAEGGQGARGRVGHRLDHGQPFRRLHQLSRRRRRGQLSVRRQRRGGRGQVGDARRRSLCGAGQAVRQQPQDDAPGGEF